MMRIYIPKGAWHFSQVFATSCIAWRTQTPRINKTITGLLRIVLTFVFLVHHLFWLRFVVKHHQITRHPAPPPPHTHLSCLPSERLRLVFMGQPIGVVEEASSKHPYSHPPARTHAHRARAQEWASDDQRHNRWRSGKQHQRGRQGNQNKRDKTWQNSDPHEVGNWRTRGPW